MSIARGESTGGRRAGGSGLILPILSLTLLAACQVQWVSDYDEQTDRAVTDYQKKMNTFFEQLKEEGWPECSYAGSRDFYAEARSEATAILTRAQSLRQNGQTVRQAESLRNNLDEVRVTHKESDSTRECLSGPYVTKSQDFMNQVVRAILWLEQGKKRQFGNPELPASLIPQQE